MKKAIIASMLAMTATAFAGDVTVSSVHDFTTHSYGLRAGTSVAGLTVTATHIDNAYNRYAVGKDFELVKVGPVALSAGAAVGYQDTYGSDNGYGLVVGAKATMPITKAIDLVASTERFTGQDRIANSNGATGTLGIKVKF